MTLVQRLLHEVRTAFRLTLYFAGWLALLLLLKKLVLDDYAIPFHKFSLALMGALILAKVVLVLEHVPLGDWVRRRPALVDLALRTLLYGVGVFVVLLLEKAFESRHEHGGFLPALGRVFQHPDMPHVLVNTIALGGALLGFNLLSLLTRRFGERELLRVFVEPPPAESAAEPGGDGTPNPGR